jgi:type II secretory pathway pseudopilin PulG
MTLVEFIVVVVLIGVLMALVLPSSPGLGRRRKAPIVFALKDMADLRSAIEVFRHDYNYLPVSTRTAALTNADFTFGTYQPSANPAIQNSTALEANNFEVIQILSGQPAPAGIPPDLDPLKRNPRGTQYFNARAAGNNHSHGLGADGVFRDPWGNPYILTFDLNGDGEARDPLYGSVSLKRQIGQTIRASRSNQSTNTAPSAEQSLPATPVFIWSFGPDGKASLSERTNAGVNRDNIVSWP